MSSVSIYQQIFAASGQSPNVQSAVEMTLAATIQSFLKELDRLPVKGFGKVVGGFISRRNQPSALLSEVVPDRHIEAPNGSVG